MSLIVYTMRISKKVDNRNLSIYSAYYQLKFVTENLI